MAVVGGGLAGLTAASLLFKAGFQTTLHESNAALGGRARTQDAHGYRFNLGPHALYLHGHAVKTLSELGVPPVGGRVPASAFWFFESGKLLAGPWAENGSDEPSVADATEASPWLCWARPLQTLDRG